MSHRFKPMNKFEICEKLRDSTYLVSVRQDDEVVSQGTGVCINIFGDLLTAAHVVAGRLPVRSKDLVGISIRGKSEGGKTASYSIAVCGFSIDVSPHLKDPITFDLAILKRDVPLTDAHYLELDPTPPRVGLEVMMAGYSDEVSLPFAFEANIDMRHPGIAEYQREVKLALSEMKFSMFKSGMVGRCYRVSFTDPKLGDITGHTFYVDNAMHSGASGGPVVDSECNLIGIITQRAITSFSTSENPGAQVPSGSAIAISAYSILEFFDKAMASEQINVPWSKVTT